MPASGCPTGPSSERISNRWLRASRGSTGAGGGPTGRHVKNPSTENLHELRKRAKDVWYAGQILRPASPKLLAELSADAHELSDLIGEDHDLALLAESAAARPDRFSEEARLDDLLGLIERRRKQLRRKALKLSARLYRRKPRAVVRRIEDAAAS